jgi:hypothetical protein
MTARTEQLGQDSLYRTSDTNQLEVGQFAEDSQDKTDEIR